MSPNESNRHIFNHLLYYKEESKTRESVNSLHFIFYNGIVVEETCRCSKELQINKPINMQAKCISAKFSWKRRGLAKVGDERQEASVAKSIKSFVLRIYAVGAME